LSPTSPPLPAAVARSRRRRAADAALARLLKLPKATTDFTRASDLCIPMRDGAVLQADHLAPVGQARGTILIRGPYGFNALGSTAFGGLLARYGYHVVLARTRGTFGSGGAFEPFVREIDDAADTVAWLREQPFFTGRFATFGGSYLGFTQWALLMDPPPELATSIMQVAPHDFSRALYSSGAFNLDTYLGWSDQVTHQEQVSVLGAQLRTATAARRQAPANATLPLASAADRLCEGRAPWFREWVTHRDLSDPYWSRMQLHAALDRVDVPVLLQTGWQDIFLDQTLDQYTHLRHRGVDVGVTIGPWTHQGTALQGYARLIPEALDWLAEHLHGDLRRRRSSPVRIQVTGSDEWRDLPAWPPASSEQVWHLQPAGALADRPAPAEAPPATFTYDPTDPTPTVGGHLLRMDLGGYKDDSRLAERPDVLAFTSSPLAAPLEIIGVPVVELAHRSSNPRADLFVRISDVDPKGRSRNVSDGFVRLDDADADDVVRLELDAIAHRFATGNRIRLLVAGGSFPRFERNLGADEDPATGTATAPSRRTVDLSGSRVLLPVPR
jgi:putative CocE/NonD family hydrolase